MMGFGAAIESLKQGRSIRRDGWNGKGMHVYLVTIDGLEPCVALFTAQGKRQPGWVPSQVDMLAEDWSVVAEEP